MQKKAKVESLAKITSIYRDNSLFYILFFFFFFFFLISNSAAIHIIPPANEIRIAFRSSSLLSGIYFARFQMSIQFWCCTHHLLLCVCFFLLLLFFGLYCYAIADKQCKAHFITTNVHIMFHRILFISLYFCMSQTVCIYIIW